jgi:hypothetical protein
MVRGAPVDVATSLVRARFPETRALDADGSGQRWQAALGERLAAGPDPLPAEDLASERYMITDLLDDLAGACDPGERTVIAAVLWERMERLWLAGHRRWTGSGKWLLRELRSADLATADRMLGALHAALAGGTDDLILLADEILAPFGGRLFNGYVSAGEDPSRPQRGDR